MLDDKLNTFLEIKGIDQRINMLNALLYAGSGHTGGSSSCLDIANALFNGGIMKYDPKNPEWADRDRFLISGHKAPTLSVMLADAGYLGDDGMKLCTTTYRDFGSPFQGHTCSHMLPGIEVSGGSLGQLISVGAGMAYALKHLDNRDSNVYVIVGDGELQEGQNWEALMSASKYNLSNLCIVVDRNKLQIEGNTEDVMPLNPLRSKFQSFRCAVREVLLHSKGSLNVNYKDLMSEFNRFCAGENGNRPTVIIADTEKAFGVDGMEGLVSSHGAAPSKEIVQSTVKKLAARMKSLEDELRDFDYDPTPLKDKTAKHKVPRPDVKVDIKAPEFDGFEIGKLVPTRKAYGAVLKYFARTGKDIVVLDADLGGSTTGKEVLKAEGFDQKRYIQLGIAEANMAGWAAGLASTVPKDGKRRLVLASSFAVFITGRCYDQVRNTIAYSKLDCNLIGTHSGLFTGKDGGSHQAIEDIALARSIPGMRVFSPSDAVSAVKSLEAAINYGGPSYVRLCREKTPTIYSRGFFDPYKAKPLRSSVRGDQVSIFATGAMVSYAIDAWEKLLKEGIKAQIYDFTCLKPLDEDAIKSAAAMGPIVTVEDHSTIGGLGEAVASLVSEKCLVKVGKVGVQDAFGQTGNPDELLKHYRMTVKDIVEKVKEVLG